MYDELTTVECLAFGLVTVLVLLVGLIAWGVSVLLHIMAAEEREQRRLESDVCRERWYEVLHDINTNVAARPEIYRQCLEQQAGVDYHEFYRWHRQHPGGPATSYGADGRPGFRPELALSVRLSRN